MTRSNQDRRTFLRRGAAAGAVLATAAPCGSCALFNKNDEHLIAEPMAATVQIPLGKFPQLEAKDGFIHIEARDGDLRLVVLRTRDDRFVALDMVCTHWGCDVDWETEEQLFVCPCHGSRFDTEGQVKEGPADEPLKRYPLTQQGDVLTIDLA